MCFFMFVFKYFTSKSSLNYSLDLLSSSKLYLVSTVSRVLRVMRDKTKKCKQIIAIYGIQRYVAWQRFSIVNL